MNYGDIPEFRKNAFLKQEKVKYGYVFSTIFFKNFAAFKFCFTKAIFEKSKMNYM